MKIQIIAMAGFVVLSGCAIDYQQIVDQSMAEGTADAFPDPADRQGIDFVFPFNPSDDAPTVWVVHIRDQVSNTEVLGRVVRYCGRLDKPGLTGGATIREVRDENRQVKLPDGTTTSGFDALYECTEA